jgi:hypothetical protein
MSTPKAPYSTFQSDWASTQQWAQQNHIAPSAYLPVYQLDASRMLQYGYPMSQGERTNAILAAAGRGVTQLPQDNPSPTNIWGNVEHNAQQLFTGLNPFNLAKNLFDTATNAVAHPEQQIFDPIKDLAGIAVGNQAAMKNFSDTVLAPHALASFVPGAYDAGQMFRGKEGFKYLADNPLTAILDVVPVGKLAMSGLAHTALGATLAEQAGVAGEELSSMTPTQLAWKIVKNRRTSIVLPYKVNGKTVVGPITTGQRITALANHLGVGREQMDINKFISEKEQEVGYHQEEIMDRVAQARAALKQDQIDKVNNYFAFKYPTDYRTQSEIVNDSTLFTPKESEFVDAYFDAQRKYNDLLINSGKLVVHNTSAGPELYIAGDERLKPIIAAEKALNDAKDALDERTKEFDDYLSTAQDVDSLFGQELPKIMAAKVNFYEFIKADLPDVTDSAIADKLKEALPIQQRFERNTPKSKLSSAKNLEDLFGLDEKTEDLVSRGRNQVAPFTGPMKEWTDAERSAWYEAQKSMEKVHGTGVTRSKIKDNAIARLKLLGSLKTVKVHSPVSARTAATLASLIGPGQLFDQIQHAFDLQDWNAFKDLTAVAKRKISGKAFQSPTAAQPLRQMVDAINNLDLYARKRKQLTDHLMGMWMGAKRGKSGGLVAKGKYASKASVASLTRAYDRAAEDFIRASRENPPAVWDNYRQVEYARQWMEHEHGREEAEKSIELLRSHGVTEANLEKMAADDRFLTEYMDHAADQTEANPMLPNPNPGVAREISKSADNFIYDLRVKGIAKDHTPLYLPTMKSHELGLEPGERYQVNLHRSRISTPQAVHSKTKMNTSRSTIYDFEAGLNKSVQEYLKTKAELEIQSTDMPRFLYHIDDLKPAMEKYFQDEFVRLSTGDRIADVDSFYNHHLEEWGLMSYDPNSIWGVTHPKHNSGGWFIHKDIYKALDETWNGDNALSRGFARGTDVFRTSVLGYSLRFTAHMIAGGGIMFAATADKSLFGNLRYAWQIAKTGKLPDELLQKFNITEDPYMLHAKVLAPGSMAGGSGEHFVQHAMSYSGAQLTIQERIAMRFGKDAADLKHPDWFTHYLQVIPELNYRTTTFVSNMYRVLALLQGLGAASKKDHFFTDEWDEASQSVKRVSNEMTPDEILREAFIHVDKVMGDVRAMAPLERNLLTRIFPFWSWTRHVLQYVVHYPADHPYRAMFLANLSEMSNTELPAGLPIRTQLLFFLNTPDQYGNVKAIDVRALNPLRDTAQYMSLSGWLSALNPIISAPFSKVDPNITFGTNVLYPSITYDALYGTNDATQSGTLWQTAEGVIPELTALDTALNLSGQYSYLAQTNRNAFYTKIFSSLGVPFLQEQSLNLRQIQATNEMKRYNQAKTAGANAWTSGDFSALAGYSEVPDPRYGTSPIPNISPSALQAIYNQTASAYAGTGLPPASVTPELTNPRL